MKKYFKCTIETAADEVFGVDIDIEGFDGTFGFVRTDSLSGVGLPKVDLGFGRSTEEKISIVVELDDVDGSLVTLKDEWLHY